VDLGVFCEKQADGWTPLHVASERGYVEAVVALVGAGEAVNLAEVSADGGVIGIVFAHGVSVCCGDVVVLGASVL
jgi:hypothetical protein